MLRCQLLLQWCWDALQVLAVAQVSVQVQALVQAVVPVLLQSEAPLTLVE